MEAYRLIKGMVVHHPAREKPYPVVIVQVKPSRNNPSRVALHFDNKDVVVVDRLYLVEFLQPINE